MQTLFNQQNSIKVGISAWPQFNYIRSALNRNLQTTISYYQSRRFTVKGNHLLVKILRSLNIPFDYPLDRIYSIIEDKSLHLAMHFNLSSSIHKGKLFDGVFYGEGVKEAIVVTTDYISPFHIEKNYKEVQAVKVLTHPKSDLSLLLPNGKSYSDESGFACIQINLAALVCQYVMFVREQLISIEEGISPQSTSVFVHSYVLPNMLYTHLDHALFNRCYNFLQGLSIGVVKYRHPFTLIDYDDKVDRFLKEVIDETKDKRLDFNTILRSLPLVTQLNLKELLRLPEQAPTRQIAWVEFLSRIKALDFMLSIAPNNGKLKNRQEVNYINKLLKRYENDSVLNQIDDLDSFQSLQTTLKLMQIRTFN